MFTSILRGPPYDVIVEPIPDGEGFVVSVPVAEDETSRVVFVETLLVLALIDGFEHHEIVFQIAVIAADDSYEPVTTQMRDIAKQYLPDDVRDFIMPIVCESCIKLLEVAKPELIYAVTKESFLPTPALVKYTRLTEAVQSCGYITYELGTDAAGRAFWKWSGKFQPPGRIVTKSDPRATEAGE